MSIDAATHARIAALLDAHHTVLFMKGVPRAPRCGFSAKAVGILDGLGVAYHTVDVLADEAIRAGIKTFGNWPTIPQLYVGKELVGGSDILTGMLNSGELHALFNLPMPDRSPPTIHISARAAQAIQTGMADAEELALHLSIDGQWRAQFQLAPAQGQEIAASDAGITILMDLATASRAQGMVIDWEESLQGGGLAIKLPGAPPAVKALSVEALRDALARGDAPTIIDVRPAQDRARAEFPVAHEVFEPQSQARLEALPRDTPLAFLCHFGNSSRQAAEHFRNLGFANLSNIEGGIDAWSQRVDTAVPRY